MRAILTGKNQERSRQLQPAGRLSKYLLLGCLLPTICCGNPVIHTKHKIENPPKTMTSGSVSQVLGKLGSEYVKGIWEESRRIVNAIDYSSTPLNQFILSIGMEEQNAISLKNGATIGAVMEIDGNVHPKDKFYARMSVFVDSATKPMTWSVDLGKLRDVYKKITGKELKYVLAAVGRASDAEVGERVWFYVIPAKSFDDVQKGNIEPGMPVLCVSYFARTNTLGWNVSAVIE